MAADRNPSPLSDILVPEIAGAIVAQSIVAGRVAGIPETEMIMALIAAAGTLARQRPDEEGWEALLPRAARLAMEAADGN